MRKPATPCAIKVKARATQNTAGRSVLAEHRLRESDRQFPHVGTSLGLGTSAADHGTHPKPCAPEISTTRLRTAWWDRTQVDLAGRVGYRSDHFNLERD